MTFRINAKNFSLTYPQANEITKEELFEHLKTFKPRHLLVAQESHEDGGKHFHASISFTDRTNVRNPKHFDYKGKHPNTQATRKVNDWLQYLEKEDAEPLEFGTRDTTKRTWADALGTGTEEEFLDAIREISPRDFILQADRIKSFANAKFKKVEEYTPEFTNYNITTHMQQWLHQYKDTNRPKSLVLCGPTRTGKTEWARSLGTHMYWNGMLNIDEWNDDATYAVIDDFKWEYLPCKKQFFGAQKQFTITDKYRKKKTVKWGKPIIYLCNQDENPFPNMTSIEREWYDNNVIFTEITKPLFE